MGLEPSSFDRHRHNQVGPDVVLANDHPGAGVITTDRMTPSPIIHLDNGTDGFKPFDRRSCTFA